MALNEQLPQWDEPGVEPPSSKKTSGYAPGDKPPAQWLNWFMNRVYKVLQEIRNKMLQVGDVAVNGDVRAATTANITLSGLQTVDGVVLAAGDRVLVKNQTTGSQNGIYVAASGAWARAADADTTAKVASGISVYVRDGAAGGGKTFVMSNTTPVTLGTTAITFADIASGTFTGTVTASKFVSTQATGTAPLQVTSTTMVANLNADMLGGKRAALAADGDTLVLRTGTGSINAQLFNSTATTGLAPLIVNSTTMVTNLNSEMVGGKKAADLVAKAASVSEFNVTSSTGQAALTFMPPASGNYQVLTYLRVTAATTVTLQVWYADAGGNQSTFVINAQSLPVGNLHLLPVFFNAGTQTITVQVSSSVSGAVKLSASILGV